MRHSAFGLLVLTLVSACASEPLDDRRCEPSSIGCDCRPADEGEEPGGPDCSTAAPEIAYCCEYPTEDTCYCLERPQCRESAGSCACGFGDVGEAVDECLPTTGVCCLRQGISCVCNIGTDCGSDRVTVPRCDADVVIGCGEDSTTVDSCLPRQ